MMKRLLAALLAVIFTSSIALAAGLWPGLPPVFPAGTTGAQNANGQSIGTGYTTLPLTGSELIPADTGLSSGRAPQTEAISVNQLGLYTPTVQTLVTSAGTLPIDASLGSLYTITLAGNPTLVTPSNLSAGKFFRIRFNQDSTGSRVVTTASIPIYKWTSLTASNAVLTTTANAQDLVSCLYDGTFVLCSPQRDYINNAGRPTTP